MAQALVSTHHNSAIPSGVGQHHLHHPSRPSRRQTRALLNSYHFHRKQNAYLTSLCIDSLRSTPQHSFLPEQASPTRAASAHSCVHSFPMMPLVESVHTDAPPSSPPDLTESKSSKSSGSLHSSCLTDATGQENLAHFEEIALADSGRSSVEIQHHSLDQKSISRLAQQRRPSNAYSRGTTTHPADSLRDAASATRPRHGDLRGQRYSSSAAKGPVGVAVHEQHAAVPGPRPVPRGFMSPSAISIGTMSMSARDRSSSRSPSPSPVRRLSSNRSFSSHSFGSRTSGFTGSHPNLARKASMQPRKTTQELEDEYHDSDEEVPEDAVIWNVPISPRPPFLSQPSSPRTRSHASLHHSPSSESAIHAADTSKSPGRPPMPHSATVAAYPSEPMSLRAQGRTKSWTQDLSAEARELTIALEEHAEAEREQSEHRPSPSSSTVPSNPPTRAKLQIKTNIIELPPLQKGNIMIDPLPISKEKEAVLSRTRPSWLPPKSQKEERRHIREWERMMAKAAEAERRRQQKQLTEEKGKVETSYNLAKIWEQHVLPNWDTVVSEPRTRELWWRGITPKSRGVVWAKAIGNELSLSEASYTTALGRAEALQQTIAELPSEERDKHKDAAWLSAIARDVPTVLPELGLFGKDAPLHHVLLNVLLAYAAYRSDVGYVYGTHSLAGLLVLNLPASEAFVALANMLNRPVALAYLVNDNAGIKRAQALVLAALKYKLPQLHQHLLDAKTGLDPDEWLTPFLMTMGTLHLSSEACQRIWDISVFEGDKTLVRATVGVLSLLESRLYGDREEILSLLGWGAEKWSFGEEEVIKAVREAGKVGGRS